VMKLPNIPTTPTITAIHQVIFLGAFSLMIILLVFD
jgi:hypothetical protein